jgi:hypothetical protein
MIICLRRNDGEFPLCGNFPIYFTFAFGEHIVPLGISCANISYERSEYIVFTH